MKFAASIVALLLASPVVVIAAVVWWKFSLAVVAVTLGLHLAGHWAARNADRAA